MDKSDIEYAFTEWLREFARKRGISPTTIYDMIASGELETFLVGNRRHVVLASYDRIVRKRVAEQARVKLPSSNPKAKAREPSIGGAAQDELGPTAAAAAPPEESVKLQACYCPAARRETGRGSDSTEALAGDLGRDAEGGGGNGGPALTPKPQKKTAEEVGPDTLMAD